MTKAPLITDILWNVRGMNAVAGWVADKLGREG